MTIPPPTFTPMEATMQTTVAPFAQYLGLPSRPTKRRVARAPKQAAPTARPSPRRVASAPDEAVPFAQLLVEAGAASSNYRIPAVARAPDKAEQPPHGGLTANAAAMITVARRLEMEAHR